LAFTYTAPFSVEAHGWFKGQARCEINPRPIFSHATTMDDSGHSRGKKLPYELPVSYQPLFTSNEPPLAHQLAEIRESAHVAEALKTSLDMQINQARMDLIRLEREALYAARHAESCKFPLSPIRRMPVEILSNIFTAYADLLHPNLCDIKNGVWMLGHVCGHWRAVALATPSLWSSFAFHCDSQPHAGAVSAAIADEFLLRSSSHPLSIAFDCGGGQFCTNGGACRDVFATLVTHCQRWRTVDLHIPPHLHTELKMVKDNIPNLAKLRLDVFTFSREEYVPFHDTETFRSCPRLVDLELALHVLDQLIDFPWHQLTRYSGSAVRGNTNVLASAPHIVDCALQYSGGTPWSQPAATPAPLTHQVQRLRLFNGAGPSSLFLDTLTLPALTHLSAHIYIAPALAALVSRSQAPLRALELSVVHRLSDTLASSTLALLAAAPSVNRLKLSANAGPDGSATEQRVSDIFRALTPPAPVLLPNLTYLALSGFVFDEAFVDMVEARCAVGTTAATASTTATTTTARLRSLHISKFGETKAHHLLRLRRIELQSGLKLTLNFAQPEPPRRAWFRVG
ncbi:hypothetical protein C8R46DRAFT_1305609, partial [Mycena filopes]